MNKNGFLVIIVILALLALLAGWWGLGQRKAKNDLTQQNEQLNIQVGDLAELKEALATEVDSLQRSYDALAEENQSLQGSLTETQSQLAQKDASLKAAKRQAAAQSNDLNAQIQELLAAKAQLESLIGAMQTENDSLRQVAGILQQDLGVAREENAALTNLNRTMQDEVKRLTLANFKATAFQVELEKKSSRATAKSTRARRIRVTFDLANVPPEYQGTRTIYMVVTDEKGTPIQTENPVMAQVVVNNQRVDIIAQKVQDVNITESQRLTFTHDLEEKLRSGFYRVAVYTDIGLLGASNFRLQ